MTIGAFSEFDVISAARELIAEIRFRNWCQQRTRISVVAGLAFPWNLAGRHGMTHGRQAAEEDDDRGNVLVRHVAQMTVRHHRQQSVPVVADTFTNSPRELVVGPVANAGFRIGREIGNSPSGSREWLE